MKKLVHSGLLTGLLAAATFGIGLQHGVFRSQATQGDMWTGTAAIIAEHYDVTVYPDYLDVELDWVFQVGGTAPAEFEDALEIVGNLNLEDNSVVVSMLVWYKDMVLKAKLKTNGDARDQYENVVERNAEAPPPPRDPVLLEMVRDDNYDISIFPVSFGGTRKVRIRYLVPGKTADGSVRMGYPHAFTGNATVTVKPGTGVTGYVIETSALPVFYTDAGTVELPRADFNFQAHSATRSVPGITSIVPILAGSHEGSLMYTGAFSTETFSGTMAHFSIQGAGAARVKSSLVEDYVVLWRWNHPEVVKLYTKQVVEQADLLKSFFGMLNGTSKRGALVISTLDGGIKTFRLDRNGGAVFNDMLTYLAELAALPVPQGGTASSTKLSEEEAQRVAEQSFEEFKQALKDAIALFDNTTDAQRHLLLLTAGPTGVYSGNTGIPESIDKSIAVALFPSYFGGGISTSSANQAWPGVALSQILTPADTSEKMYAYITNGVQTDSFQTTGALGYYGTASIADRFIYSAAPLKNELRWKIFKTGQVVSEFTETPTVIVIDDGMQYARCIGALAGMMPLAETMPASLASTLGFIDMKYTLLALEDDFLDPAEAGQYQEHGVPLLEKADIFQADGDKAIVPVDEWLKANPRSSNPEYQILWDGMRAGDIIFDMVPEVAAGNNGGPVRWANPAADVIYPSTASADGEAFQVAPVRQSAPMTAGSGAAVSIVRNLLQVQLGASILPSAAELVLYDLHGRVVMRWKLDRLVPGGAQVLRVRLPALTKGMYLLRLEKAPVQLTHRFVVK